MTKKIIQPENKNFKDYINLKHTTLFSFNEIQNCTVEKMIDNLIAKSCYGWDEMFVKLTESYQNSFSKPTYCNNKPNAQNWIFFRQT